ncbi:MAG: UDP-glucose 4-epimerase GalE [Okeania sp. SIO1H6]|nr:UDP-glucose 4-epimerase GalE [Okeania sp. SIO1H6]
METPILGSGSSQTVFVTGGAGYIGSHIVKQLGEGGYNVVVYDNLSNGSPNSLLYGKLIIGDLQDWPKLAQVFAEYQFQAVLHLAASLSVSESVANPLKYYANNTVCTLHLLKCCQQFGVNKLVFSSTAAVYGEMGESLVTESAPTIPINPYGRSKLMSERMIQDYSQVSDLKYVIFRYFNVAGADLSGKIGQSDKKATHLIKVCCDAALGRRQSVSIFGTDYPTFDGTAIRDYIHVQDLAKAHLDALTYLQTAQESQILNCGYSRGYSVYQVIDKVKEISGVNFQTIKTQRREGDSTCVVASADKIRRTFGWQPQYNSLDTIIRTAFNWEKKNN